MAVVDDIIDGVHHWNVLEDYVKRGNLYAAYSNDGKSILVYLDSPVGYPTGETLAHIPVDQVGNLIAALRAVELHG